jgi:autotransporter-associated beta strand protein
MKRSTRLGSVVLVLALLALGLAGQANAAPMYFTNAGGPNTWDNATTADWGLATGGPYAVLWSNGADAHFEGTAGTVNVSGTIASVNSIAFDVTGYTLGGGAGNIITMTGAGGKITTGAGITSTINSAITSAGGLTVEGSGTLNLGGVATLSGGFTILGNSTAGNTLNVANGAQMLYSQKQSLQIGAGAAANGGNVLNVSTPGTSAAPTIRVGPTDIGLSSSNNELNISNGAYYARHTYNGQGAWTLGQNAGADNNRIIITGTDSSGNPSTGDFRFESGLRQFIKVGMAGSGNYIKAEAGGRLTALRLNIAGEGAGDNNYVLITGKSSITGTPSTFYGYDAQFIFQIGTFAGATGNSFRVEDGATGSISGQTQTSRIYAIGAGNGSDNNYLRVTGTGSALTLQHTNPVTIGGTVTGGNATPTITDSNVGGNTATGNHLDVYSGGALTLAATTSLYVMGVDSAFNLGDGTGTSTATVGSNGGVIVPGVYLKNASGRLNINSGRLTAGAGGKMVSGLGQIDLLGPAYLSTTFANSTIDSVIYGPGSLTKEGAGTLDLTLANSYTGDTIVTAGILQMENAYLADAADVRFTGGVMNLNTAGASDTIDELYFGAAAQATGTWGSSLSGATHQDDTYFSGNGMLNVMTPEPATLAFVALGGLGLLARRRRPARARTGRA